jgi:hypothetical protein
MRQLYKSLGKTCTKLDVPFRSELASILHIKRVKRRSIVLIAPSKDPNQGMDRRNQDAIKARKHCHVRRNFDIGAASTALHKRAFMLRYVRFTS